MRGSYTETELEADRWTNRERDSETDKFAK